MTRDALTALIAEGYGAQADYPFAGDRETAVFRHTGNRKWFALVMTISTDRLGLPDSGMIDIVNLKCDPLLVGSVVDGKGVFPAYHMSKTHWISVVLDDRVPDDRLLLLLDMSYALTSVKPPRVRGKQ